MISGNAGFGLGFFDVGTDGNVVAGNLIGTDADGTDAVANRNHGVRIGFGARDNWIGTNGDGVGDSARSR